MITIEATETQMERYVSALMLELGVPAHLRGYYYLREAIVLTARDMELVGSVTKLLYPGSPNARTPISSGWNARSATRSRFPGREGIRRCSRSCSATAALRACPGRPTANISRG